MKACLNQKCKKLFTPKRERAKFCSDICRATHHQNVRLAKNKVDQIMSSLDEVELIEKGEKATILFKDLLAVLGNPIIKTKKEFYEHVEEKKFFPNKTDVSTIADNGKVIGYTDILNLIKSGATKEEIQALTLANKKLTPGQKEMIHSKLKTNYK